MPRPGFLDSLTLQGDKKMLAFGKNVPHGEAFYKLLSHWKEFEMEGPKIQKGVFPLNAEKEKGVYWALM